MALLLSASATLSCNAGAEELHESAYQTLEADGFTREFSLFVPSSYDAAVPVPLLLEFHGSGASPESQQRLSAFPNLAEEQGFIIVAPKARYPIGERELLSWNVDLHEDGPDDVAFVSALIDEVMTRYAIDESRIYATGFSGGARMSSRVACDLSHRVAAIGPVGGVRFPEVCEPARPVPVISFHGRQDNVNHYEHQSDSPDYWRMGVEQALGGWIAHNGCGLEPVVHDLSDTDRRRDYQGCKQDGDVVFHVSNTASHTWPGSPLAEGMFERWGAVTADVPATRLIWSFFEAHPLPPSRVDK